MRRSLALRIGTLLLVVFTTTAPAFAAPQNRDGSPVIDRLEQVISRIMSKIRHIVPLDGIVTPK